MPATNKRVRDEDTYNTDDAPHIPASLLMLASVAESMKYPDTELVQMGAAADMQSTPLDAAARSADTMLRDANYLPVNAVLLKSSTLPTHTGRDISRPSQTICREFLLQASVCGFVEVHSDHGKLQLYGEEINNQLHPYKSANVLFDMDTLPHESIFYVKLIPRHHDAMRSLIESYNFTPKNMQEKLRLAGFLPYRRGVQGGNWFECDEWRFIGLQYLIAQREKARRRKAKNQPPRGLLTPDPPQVVPDIGQGSPCSYSVGVVISTHDSVANVVLASGQDLSSEGDHSGSIDL